MTEADESILRQRYHLRVEQRKHRTLWRVYLANTYPGYCILADKIITWFEQGKEFDRQRT